MLTGTLMKGSTLTPQKYFQQEWMLKTVRFKTVIGTTQEGYQALVRSKTGRLIPVHYGYFNAIERVEAEVIRFFRGAY